MSDVAIVTQGLRRSFGPIKAVDGVDLGAPAGTVLGLLGPNGAGKTTIVRILTTLLTPDAGTARVAGFDVVRDAEALRSVIGLAGQYAAVDETLTGRENLDLVGRLYHLGRSEARRPLFGFLLESLKGARINGDSDFGYSLTRARFMVYLFRA
jgi:ABC-2 type transport system ATP-binding protein